MYHDTSSRSPLERLQQLCPNPEHIILSASSGLAKALQLHASLQHREDIRLCSQADFLLRWLGAPTDRSDYHNALKLGFDVEQLNWPEWIRALLPRGALPSIVEPGQALAKVDRSIADRFGINPDLVLCAGSTDANAAFIATGARQPGDAVTSLGTTLVVKQLCGQPIEQLASGVYSHRLGDLWLTGGASNAGGNILRRYFSDTQLSELSAGIDPRQSSGLDYYPLPEVGERFPVLDPAMQPRLEPRPESDVTFLHGLLEGLARIEQCGYQLLQELGAPPLQSIQTLGGGAANETWRRMRENLIGVPVARARHTQAAYGSALLARDGLNPYR
jgi:sugar (pentulose or hexulose) kinase